jgi:hypothetical protein
MGNNGSNSNTMGDASQFIKSEISSHQVQYSTKLINGDGCAETLIAFYSVQYEREERRNSTRQ